MTYVYIGSPYTSFKTDTTAKRAQEEYRYEEVMRYCTWLIEHTSYYPFSPIIHCHEWARRYQLPGTAAFWRRYNFAMLNGAQQLHVLNLTGAMDSVGLADEIAQADLNRQGIWLAQDVEDETGRVMGKNGYALRQTNIQELASILR